MLKSSANSLQAWEDPGHPVFQDLLRANRKSLSMASLNSSHACVIVSATTEATVPNDPQVLKTSSFGLTAFITTAVQKWVPWLPAQNTLITFRLQLLAATSAVEAWKGPQPPSEYNRTFPKGVN
ncbi:hypothetical protein CHARACLAT_023416 [Characodon lateralis]|uniref:Uncharacterized protein n=1 Tax=Characodon lateralis TaxID=208331 RepID=A0ABU7DTK8_9TELE|nr:hypothetical protein [Characodon lateralis]